MSLKLITAPVAEPIDLATAKLHLRVDTAFTADDTLITALIVAARQGAESLTGRALMPQTWELALHEFPCINVTRVCDSKNRFVADAINLPKPPFVSITSVSYVDEVGDTQTIAEADYQLDTHSEPAKIMPVYGTYWPATRDQANAVLIRFIAGYADADAVPQQIKNWMLLRIGTLYEHREGIASGVSISEIPYIDRLLDEYKVWSV